MSGRVQRISLAVGAMALCLIGMAAMTIASSRADRAALDAATNGHRSVRQMLNPIHLKFRTQAVGADGRITEHEGEFWQNGDSRRWQKTMAQKQRDQPSNDTSDRSISSTNDGIVVDGRIVELGIERFKSGASKGGGSIRDMDQNDLPIYYPWNLAVMHIQDSPLITALDVLESADWSKKAEEEADDDERLIHVTATNAKLDGTAEIWFSPRHSYLAKKIRTYGYRGTFRTDKKHHELEVLFWHQPQADSKVSFPARGVQRFVENGGVTDVTTTTTFDRVEIGQSISAEVFKLSIPPGTVVVDRVNKRQFIMGEDGRPSKAHPIEPLTTIPIFAIPQPVKESRSWMIWIAVIGGIAVIGAAALFFWHRRRA